MVWAAECGTLAHVKGGQGYTPRPDWQQGALTVEIADDGSSLVEAACPHGRIRWRGQAW